MLKWLSGKEVPLTWRTWSQAKGAGNAMEQVRGQHCGWERETSRSGSRHMALFPVLNTEKEVALRWSEAPGQEPCGHQGAGSWK